MVQTTTSMHEYASSRREGELDYLKFGAESLFGVFVSVSLIISSTTLCQQYFGHGHRRIYNLLLLLLVSLPVATAPRSERLLPLVQDRALVIGILESKSNTVTVLHEILNSLSPDWNDVARRVWSLTSSLGTTGDYDHEARPASAINMMNAFNALKVKSILWSLGRLRTCSRGITLVD